MYYTIDIAGIKRDLKLYSVGPDSKIAAFILFGDVEITKHAAAELLRQAPDFDIIFTAEAKSIPLAYEMAAQSGRYNYVIARKGLKVYMENAISVSVQSITTKNIQTLYIGDDVVDLIRGKRVLIVDDVVSTGESLSAMEALVEKAGGTVAGKMFVLAEGDAANRDDVTYLAKLPLFSDSGEIK